MNKLLKTYLNEALHLIYPHVCICCQHKLEESEDYICKSCYSAFDKFFLPEESNEAVVARLKKHFPTQSVIKEGSALYRFHKGGLLQEVIYSIKYSGLQALAIELGARLGQHILSTQKATDWEAILPVPLHPVKFIERGYNQSEALAQGMSQVMNIPVIRDAVERIKYTNSQTGLSSSKRRENMREVFRIQKALELKRVLLVDDVLTTGATLVALSHKLTMADVKHIGIATLAITSH